MYLKSIEVHGFKSFAHKLIFQFKDGITGIVGPNGSGKSNVADAVRWVLGEQSAKQLRGSKMEDIIFSGTETRRPLGFAYVAITFDNTDHSLPLEFDEVTVARRVYRSGESEYLINGSTCLLKDVKEMFFDTGIGKEGYSIIGQGQIDKILSGKPEDRRELFDEAAGIVKYKRRKATTQKNLDVERQNLVRVNDILSELEIQVGPLQKQSDKAKKYLSFKEELKTKDIQMYILEYERVNEQLEEIKKKEEVALKDLENAAQQYSKSRKFLDDLEQTLNNNNEDIEKKKAQVNTNNIKAEQLEGNVKVYEQQISSAKENEEQFVLRVKQLDIQLDNEQSEYQLLLQQKEENTIKIEDCVAKQKEAENNINEIFACIKQQEQEIDHINQKTIHAMNESSDIKSEQKKYETMLEQLSIKKAEMNQSLFRLKTDVEKAKEASINLEGSILDKTTRIKDMNAKLQTKKYDLNEVERKKKSLLIKQQDIQKNFHSTNSHITTLKNLAERYEGYGQSIKKVMEQKKNNPGLIGVVADIISVEKKYEIAVETSLGGNIQNIVTEDESTAKAMIEYLKKNKLGRATFLPLSNITADANFDSSIRNEPGVYGPISEFVHVDQRYKEIISYLMGRFILVDSIENALKLAKKYRNTLRIVTLEGEFLNVGGSISGGAYRNTGNLLARRRELEELEVKLQKTKELLDKSKESVLKCEESSVIFAEEIRSQQALVQEIQLELGRDEVQLEQAKTRMQESTLEYETAKNDSGMIETEKSTLQLQLDNTFKQLDLHKNRNEEYKNKINEILVSLEENKKIRSNMHEEINQLSLNKIALSQTEGFIEEKLERSQALLLQIAKDKELLEKNNLSNQNMIDEKKNDIEIVKETIISLREETLQLTNEIASSAEKYEKLVKQQKDEQKQRESLADKRNDLEKEQIRILNQSEKSQAQFASLNQYMWNEYELTYRSALEYKAEDMLPYSQLKQETQELKQKIKNLGDINVNAIEEYITISERYTTMKQQHDDIVESENRLLGFIEDLEDKMRKQFIEKFEEIKIQYNIVFRELFGGGKGTLDLTENEDVLEAGVRIIAQPPGKALKSMSMLSGGEKALSAIAILFAIQNLKPSPFCLLDEIEAALDDSNVKRFAKYLNKLKNKTQYIVITHRQGTMAAADTLYGITMQEKGVSTLVSVDLVEQQLEKGVNHNG